MLHIEATPPAPAKKFSPKTFTAAKEPVFFLCKTKAGLVNVCYEPDMTSTGAAIYEGFDPQKLVSVNVQITRNGLRWVTWLFDKGVTGFLPYKNMLPAK